jgi:protein-S-isoprenylcysteine O-methyltransferase Ste14
VGLAGLLSLITALAVVAALPTVGRGAALVTLLLAVSLPMLGLEIFFNRHALFVGRLAPTNPGRVATKLCGLALTFGVIGLGYWAFPIYRTDQAAILIALLKYFAVPLALVTVPYIWLTDRLMDEPEDGLYMAGLAASGQWDEVDRAMLAQYALGWLVKGFFLPLMLWNSWQNVDLLLPQSPVEAIAKPPYGWYEFAYSMIYFIDVLFASVGYVCTFRLLNLHIRWAEDTARGWLACLACYAPFWDPISRNYLPYAENDHGWGYWFGSATTLGSVWGALILLVVTFHVWATVIFGLRFSNLTNRGIITNGPFRWSKHPAYVSKLLSYAMIWLPFLNAVSWENALRNTLLFGCLAYIYYTRAKAEEAYLMKEPDYRAYAEYIDRHGILATIRRSTFDRMSRLVQFAKRRST